MEDKELLVKGHDFTAWTVGDEEDLWIEIRSAFFERGLCILDLGEAKELLVVLKLAIKTLNKYSQ